MNLAAAKEALKKYYGYDSFRPMQAEIIQALYDRKDVLVLMPTGGGKSLCYQIPALTMSGTAIVVSPLISLMKDQVESLLANGVRAAFLNSSQTSSEQNKVEDDLFCGKLDLLYVSPEKLVSQQFFPLLKRIAVSLFAIDEAHCISSWGHDFRPEYTKMSFIKNQFDQVPVIALTATADRLTRQDIVKQLSLDTPEVFIASFDRPNLSLTVRPGQKRKEQILDFVDSRPNQPGIIYCLSRKNCEKLATTLRAAGYKARYYHAGMDARERSEVQEAFINDNIQMVCATIAFGMGIDKSNVRWVIHYNMPKNIESYYQEIGRAGRDGTKADTMLFYSFNDYTVLRDILEGGSSEEMKEIKLSKLERMMEFADSPICRRKTLLNYFGESLHENCGNCDICANPPKSFDGTILTQKALSAVIRLKEKVGINLLIDVLRGSRKREILEKGYDRIKTYGIGGDISYQDWRSLIRQMIQLGLLEIAYDQNYALQVTEAGRAVLFNNQKVPLVQMSSIKEQQKLAKAKAKPKSQRERVRDDLFEVLRALRKELAQKNGVPPYIIFNDATLEEMAASRPKTEQEMLTISGVGEHKLNKYGRLFIQAIITYLAEKSREGVRIQGATHILSIQHYNRGLSPEQIAIERDLKVGTVYGHLLKGHQEGMDVNIKRLVSRKELMQVKEAKDTVKGEEGVLKPLYEHLNGAISYGKIRIGLYLLEHVYAE